jgi:hypothetical protein
LPWMQSLLGLEYFSHIVGERRSLLKVVANVICHVV